jgi:hypothetical protein
MPLEGVFGAGAFRQTLESRSLHRFGSFSCSPAGFAPTAAAVLRHIHLAGRRGIPFEPAKLPPLSLCLPFGILEQSTVPAAHPAPRRDGTAVPVRCVSAERDTDDRETAQTAADTHLERAAVAPLDRALSGDAVRGLEQALRPPKPS